MSLKTHVCAVNGPSMQRLQKPLHVPQSSTDCADGADNEDNSHSMREYRFSAQTADGQSVQRPSDQLPLTCDCCTVHRWWLPAKFLRLMRRGNSLHHGRASGPAVPCGSLTAPWLGRYGRLMLWYALRATQSWRQGEGSP